MCACRECKYIRRTYGSMDAFHETFREEVRDDQNIG